MERVVKLAAVTLNNQLEASEKKKKDERKIITICM